MTIMLGCDASGLVHYLAGKYPGALGWLFSPSTGFKEPRYWLPYAIDNGKFSCGETWNEGEFYALLDRCRFSKYKPGWVAVPDEVGNKKQTLRLWDEHADRVRQYGWPIAFVVQDGMTPRDVPNASDIVFIGGSTTWKWRNVATFCAAFPHVHVGRVNVIEKIEYCERLGVESCDGTGFFRKGEGSPEALQLQEFLSGRRRHKEQLQLV